MIDSQIEDKQTLQSNYFCSVVGITMCAVYCFLRAGISETPYLKAIVYLGAGLLTVNFPGLLKAIGRKIHPEFIQLFFFCDPALTLILMAFLMFLGMLLPYSTLLTSIITIVGFLSLGFTTLFYFKCKSRKYQTSIFGILLGVGLSSAFFSIKHHDIFFMEKLEAGEPFALGTDTLFHAALTNIIANLGKISTGLDGVPFTPYHIGSHYYFGQLGKLLSMGSLSFFLFGYAFFVIPLFLKAIISFIVAVSNLTRTNLNDIDLADIFLCLSIASVALVLPFLNESILFYSGPFLGESYGFSLTLFFLIGSLILYLKRLQQSGIQVNAIELTILCIIVVPFLGASISASKFSTGYVFLAILTFVAIWKKENRKAFFLLSTAITACACYFAYKSLSFPYQVNFQILSIYSEMSALQILSHGMLFYLPLWILITVNYFNSDFGNRDKSIVELAFIISVVCFIPTVFLNLAGGSVLYFLDPQYWLNWSLLLAILFKSEFLRNVVIKRSLCAILLIQTLAGAYNLNNHFQESKIALGKHPAPIERAEILNNLNSLSKLPWRDRTHSVVFIPQNNKDYWNMLEPLTIPFLEPAITGMAMIDGLPPVGFIGSIYYNYANFGYGVRSSKIQDDSQSNVKKLANLWGFRTLIRLDNPSSIPISTKVK